MKRILALTLSLVLMLALTACGNNSDSSNISKPERERPVEHVEQPSTTIEQPLTSYEITDSRSKTWTNSIGSVWVQTIVEITNTGTTNLYLSDGSYDLEDASGNLVSSQTMVSAYPDVLAPGEKGYMYDESTLDEAVDGKLTVIPREDVEEATVDLIRFTVTETKITDGKYGGLKMIGRVENTTEEEEDGLIYVVAFLYDSNGSCIGQMFTFLSDDLAPGDKIGFEMTDFALPDDITADSVADYIVYAYPMQYQF